MWSVHCLGFKKAAEAGRRAKVDSIILWLLIVAQWMLIVLRSDWLVVVLTKIYHKQASKQASICQA